MSLEKIINDAWEKKDQVNQNSDKSLITWFIASFKD